MRIILDVFYSCISFCYTMADRMSGESSWEKLKKCKVYQRFGTNLEIQEDNGKLGEHQRWQDAIVQGAHIIFRNVLNRRCVYRGDGFVMDIQTEQVDSLSQWAVKVHLARHAVDAPPLKGVTLKPPAMSGPQTCKVLLFDATTQEIYFVYVKIFDYVRLESKITFDGPLQWYHNQVPLVAGNVNLDSDEPQPVILPPRIPLLLTLPAPEGPPVEATLPHPERPLEEGAADQVDDQTTEEPKRKQRKIAPDIPRAYHIEEDNKKKIPDNLLRTIWEACYGKSSVSTCMMCGVAEVDFSRRSDTQLCHINPKSLLGRSDKIYNYIFACSTCNNNGATRTCNGFDQLYLNCHLDKANRLCETSLRLYCQQEAVLEHQFKGRLDYVMQVHGVCDDGVPSGIVNPAVFEYLAALDRYAPLSPTLLNPLARGAAPPFKTPSSLP